MDKHRIKTILKTAKHIILIGGGLYSLSKTTLYQSLSSAPLESAIVIIITGYYFLIFSDSIRSFWEEKRALKERRTQAKKAIKSYLNKKIDKLSIEKLTELKQNFKLYQSHDFYQKQVAQRLKEIDEVIVIREREDQVEQLKNEQKNCQLSEIKPEHKVWFSTLAEAHADGYDNCAWCIGNSKR